MMRGVPVFAKMKKLFTDDSGATAIEYALIASLIAMVIIGTLTALGSNLTAHFSSIAAALPTGS